MSDETIIEAPKATLFVERSVKVRDYESLKVAMHFPVDLPVRTLYVDGQSGEFQLGAYLTDLDEAIKAGFTTVKAHIFEQLGLEFEDKNGVLIEKVAAHFKGAAEIQTPRPERALKPVPSTPVEGQPATCAGCGGDKFFDNRQKKASGEYKSSAPDFKCANKPCSKGVWPEKRGSN